MNVWCVISAVELLLIIALVIFNVLRTVEIRGEIEGFRGKVQIKVSGWMAVWLISRLTKKKLTQAPGGTKP